MIRNEKLQRCLMTASFAECFVGRIVIIVLC
jgi:hypothetical protein